MGVIIDGSNTPTAGGVGYGDGFELAFTSAGTSGQVLTSAGAGVPTWGSVGVAAGGTGVTTLTTNNVILGNGTSAVQFVAPGTSGNVLTSNGTTWASTAPAGGGSLILLSTTAASGASVTITSGFSSTYDDYVLYADNIANSGAALWFRGRYSGTVLTSNYDSYTMNGISPTANSGVAQMYSGNSTFTNGSFVMNILNANSATYRKSITWFGTGTSSAAGWILGSGSNTSTAVLDGIQILLDGTTFTSGTFRLYGVKKT